MSAILIVLCGLLVVLSVLRLAKGRAVGIKSPDDLRAQLCALDVDAFRNLTDPREDEYLHSHLSRSAYRKVKRERLRATLAYVSCVAKNAAVLIRMGEEARRSSNASVAEAGVKLVDSALRLRLQTFQVKSKLYLQLLYPGGQTQSEQLVSMYEQMARQGIQLGRLQYPESGISGAF